MQSYYSPGIKQMDSLDLLRIRTFKPSIRAQARASTFSFLTRLNRSKFVSSVTTGLNSKMDKTFLTQSYYYLMVRKLMAARRESQKIPVIVAIIGIIAFSILLYLALGFLEGILDWFRSYFSRDGTPILELNKLIAS